jgi:hypothetical protein
MFSSSVVCVREPPVNSNERETTPSTNDDVAGSIAMIKEHP